MKTTLTTGMQLPSDYWNIDSARRSRLEHATPSLSRERRQSILAQMYGYDLWDDLASAGRAGVRIPFDRDLPEEKRHNRLLGMARRVARAEGFCLVEAIDLVYCVSPTTHDILRDQSLDTYSQIYDEAIAEERSVYWACRLRSLPDSLVPPGFDLKEAHSVADGAQYRLYCDPTVQRQPTLWILCPEPPWGALGIGHIYFRRGDYLEVQPIPSDDLLRGMSGQTARQRRENLLYFFRACYPKLRVAERAKLFEQWRSHLMKLSHASGVPTKSRRRGLQFTIALRERLGRQWYWPLVPFNADEEVLAKSERHARAEDAEIRRHFGRDPGYFYSC